MIFKTVTLVSYFLFSLFLIQSEAATYNYYFSSNGTGNPLGSDTTGDGSKTKPWKTLSKAQKTINSHEKTDIVNLYFDRGDTWTWDSDAVIAQNYIINVRAAAPIVNIDAYGTGNRPIFDGTVEDFASVPVHNTTTGPLKWNRFFEIARANSSISNLEIKNIYGHAVYLKATTPGGADGFRLFNCKIYNFGGSAITSATNSGLYGIANAEVSYNLMHTGQQLERFDKIDGWSAAIIFGSYNLGDNGLCKNNHIHHNVIYDIFGEGIIVPNSIVEYNIIGDTASFGIGTDPRDFDNFDAKVRYNLLVFSDYQNSDYTFVSFARGGSGRPVGIRWYDELKGGDNSSGNVEIYGNVIINRWIGFWFFSPEDPNNPLNSIKVYDNLVIDSHETNYYFAHAQEAKTGAIYDNSSIFYDRLDSMHIKHDTSFPHSNWNINNNHFWTKGKSPVVPSAWRKNYNTNDPKLLGEPAVNWTNLSEEIYHDDINPEEHLKPPADSPVFGLSPLLIMNIDQIIKFSNQPSKPADFHIVEE